MGQNLIPELFDEQVLAAEIKRLRENHSKAEVERALHAFKFHRPDLEYEGHLGLQRSNTWWCIDASEIREQLLTHARKENRHEAVSSATALFEFLGAFALGCGIKDGPFNEYGFASSVIIGCTNVRRLHRLYQSIDFKVFRDSFAQQCRAYPEGLEYQRITSFEDLVFYCEELDDLLVQAEAANKLLYIWVSF